LLIPVLTILSFGWSTVPAEAMRLGILMVVNFVAMIAIATRLTRRQIIRCIFFAGAMTVIYLAPYTEYLGIDTLLGSKNYLSIRMMLTALAALAVAYDSDEPYPLRFAAVGVAAVAIYFCYLGNSATSLALTLGGAAILTAMWIVWQPASRIAHLRSFVVFFGIAGMVGLVMVLLSMPNNSIVDDVLGAFGKDATLTNRTIMWEAGNRVANEKPLFGHGMNSFWQPTVGAAQTLNEIDHRAPGTKHSFHNVYIEVRVALGYVGLTLLCIQLAWAFAFNLRAWFQSRGMPASFFLLVGVMIFITSFTESYLLGAFEAMVMLYYLGGITALALPYHNGMRQRVLLRPA
jgi:exopolysaccharide production protein ExoQ